jgi:LemA protein
MIGPILAIVAVVVIAPLVAYAVSYNRLVNDRGGVADAWAVIDAELQRRHHLIPPLVESVRAVAAHERRLLAQLTEAQAAATRADSPATRSNREIAVDQAIRAVVALREQNPSLNSQANFLVLQHELTLTEDRVAAARRFYNTRVANLNRRVDAFPSNIVARRHRFAQAEFYGS